MVVEVVAESLDVGDDFVSSGRLEMAREENESNVANISGARGRQAGHALQFQRRVVTEEDLWGVLDSSAAGIDEFLQEDLAEDAVCLLAEDCAENDSDTIVTGLDIDGFLLAVVNGSDLTTLKDTLGSRLGSVLGCFLMQSLVLIKSLLEGGSHGVAL